MIDSIRSQVSEIANSTKETFARDMWNDTRPVITRAELEKRRNKIAKDTKKFLEGGGEIESVPYLKLAEDKGPFCELGLSESDYKAEFGVTISQMTVIAKMKRRGHFNRAICQQAGCTSKQLERAKKLLDAREK